MRGSGWIVPSVASILWAAIVLWPAATLVRSIMGIPATEVHVRPLGELLLTSVGWSAGIALGAVVVGWIPGRVLGKSLGRRGFLPLAALLLAPICLPSYLVFYAWWQSWPPDSSLFRWVIEHDLVRSARLTTLAVGLLCWSWPIVSWCVAGTVAATPSQRDELLKLDGAGIVCRWVDHLRTDARGLAIGALLVFLVVFNNTTCFDLAEVFTFANEVRAIEALGANAAQVVAVAAPARGMALVGAILVWLLLSGRAQPMAERTTRATSAAWTITAAIWLVSVAVPMTLFARSMFAEGHGWSAITQFMRLYWASLVNTLGLALVSGVLAAAIAIGLTAMWRDHRRWVGIVAHVQAVSWLLLGLAPAIVVALALHAAFARGVLEDSFYRTPWVLIPGHLASFGFVAALLGRWMVTHQPRELRDLMQLDGAGTLVGQWQSSRPQIIAASVATIAAVFVLAVGEIPVTAYLNPPMPAGSGPLAVTMLNDMHYQRPQTVMAAALVLMALALIAALIVCAIMRPRPAIRTALALAIATVLSACTGDFDSSDPSGARPVKVIRSFGSPGVGKSQFNYPRAIEFDPTTNCVYIIDKAARVQRIDLDGLWRSEWRMPEFEYGKPTGVSVAPSPDGRIFIPDTHYHRIMAYDADGRLQTQFGSYGEEPGHFIYPTDVAFGPEGRLYVSEYGGNDRVQVFDAQGRYLFEFGSPGSEAGQFNRPQSMAFSADKSELFVADACNHRIVVTDPNGKVLRMFGSPGREPGQLAYPYGLAILDDGTIMVSEFGNNRVQQFDPDGRSLGAWGRVGRGEGDLQYPWAVASTGREVLVLDSGNNRVQVMRKP
jgi:DNA-binding beta-propeller fold protein YncE/ABC-type Fe3+ transport system permease subunit